MQRLEELQAECHRKENGRQPLTIAFFGHFDSTNFGNESSLQAMLYNIRHFEPDAKLFCISSGPEATSATHHIRAVPLAARFIKLWMPRNTLSRILHKICIAVPTEAYRWLNSFVLLKHVDMLIVPGTGLLTDAYGLLGWGPYTLLRWSLIAKLCGCRVFLVSVGAGPLHSVWGRWSVKRILSVASFRSYRDNTSLQYLASFGCSTDNDRVYPDLAFSLPEAMIPRARATRTQRWVVGIGVMGYAERYGVADATEATHNHYLENLAIFAQWLLSRGCKIRILIGDLDDTNTVGQFRELLRARGSPCHAEHIVDQPIRSVGQLLSEIGMTDIVVATRFHNVLLSLFCIKPVISISFHHKCEALMSSIGLSEYCLDIRDFEVDHLIARFRHAQENYENVKAAIQSKTREFRQSLDEQYRCIFTTP